MGKVLEFKNIVVVHQRKVERVCWSKTRLVERAASYLNVFPVASSTPGLFFRLCIVKPIVLSFLMFTSFHMFSVSTSNL
jgi:hypothetical protein